MNSKEGERSLCAFCVGFAVYTILRNKPGRKHFIWASRELLGSPGVQAPSISAKWKTLKLEMHLEIFLLWFQHTLYWFSPCSVFQVLNKNIKICSGHCELWDCFSLIQLKSEWLDYGLFSPTQLTSSSAAAPLQGYTLVSKDRELAAGQEGNMKNTSWNHFCGSFTENTYKNEKHI